MPTLTAARLDAACAGAVDLARAAAVEQAGDAALVGAHLGVQVDGDRVALHRFASELTGYVGWEWVVQVARAARARVVTVDEVVLVAGEGAVVAPAWVPWSERLRPGDVGVGDLLPTAADDPRLTLRAADVDGWVDTDLFWELGLGRPRVLSSVGRDEAVERWLDGDPGPEAPVARAAPATCASCGFFVRLTGVLGRAFGACANAFAPDDGRVVALDHGCGAHSEALARATEEPQALDAVPAAGDAPSEPADHS